MLLLEFRPVVLPRKAGVLLLYLSLLIQPRYQKVGACLSLLIEPVFPHAEISTAADERCWPEYPHGRAKEQNLALSAKRKT